MEKGRSCLGYLNFWRLPDGVDVGSIRRGLIVGCQCSFRNRGAVGHRECRETLLQNCHAAASTNAKRRACFRSRLVIRTNRIGNRENCLLTLDRERSSLKIFATLRQQDHSVDDEERGEKFALHLRISRLLPARIRKVDTRPRVIVQGVLTVEQTSSTEISYLRHAVRQMI